MVTCTECLEPEYNRYRCIIFNRPAHYYITSLFYIFFYKYSTKVFLKYYVIFTIHKLRNITFIVVKFYIVMFMLIPILNENLFLNFKFSYKLIFFVVYSLYSNIILYFFYFISRHSLKLCYCVLTDCFYELFFPLFFFHYYYYLIQNYRFSFVTSYYFSNYSLVVHFILVPVPCCVYDPTKNIV